MKNLFLTKTRWLVTIMLLTALGSGNAWGAVVSGTTYNTNTSSFPTGWTESHDSKSTTSYLVLAKDNYIQTDAFCQKSITSVKVKARKYGGPTATQRIITVEWVPTSGSTIVLGTLDYTTTTLTDKTLSSFTNTPATNTEGSIKISCKGATSAGVGDGVSQVTITYTGGSCSGGCTNPSITTQPSGATYTEGDTPSALSVTASGTSLTYQWYSNTTATNSGGTSISGATSASYTPSASSAGTFYYYCVVSSGSCSTASNAVTITVNAAGGGGSGDYVLVEDAEDIGPGQYLIVYNNTYALNTHYGNYNANTYATYTDISSYYSSKKIASNATTDALAYTVSSTTNGYSIKHTETINSVATDVYLGCSTATNSGLRWDYPFTASTDEWTLGVNEVRSVAQTGRYIRWNNSSSSYRFATYTSSSQQAIQLFKKDEPACEELGTIGGSVKSISGTSVTLNWTGLSNVSSWTVTCKKGSTSAGTIGAISGTSTKACTISGLTAGETYTFTISATAASGYCDKSEEITATTPKITVSPTTITGLNYAEGSGPSEAQSFTVNAVGLTGNLTVTAPTNFLVCATSGGTYTSSITLTPSSGSIFNATVYVKLAGGLSQATYGPSNVTVSGGSATTVNVSVTGMVSSACDNPTINTQPVGASYRYNQSATNLSVVATKTGSGPALTYQWYTNSTNSTSGATAIDGATKSTYKPATNAVGDKYYYCIVYSGACSTTTNIVKVTVNKPVIKLNNATSNITLAFGDKAVSSENTLTFTVSGTYMAGNISIAKSGTNQAMFTFTPNSVTHTDGTAASTTITVTYTPTTAASHTATLTLTSTQADSRTVTLTGTGKWPVSWKNGENDYTTGVVSPGMTLVANNGHVSGVPTPPDGSPCEMTFQGWTNTSSYVHGTSPLFTDAASSPAITAATTFYAVFAEGSPASYTLVESDLDDDWAGDYLVAYSSTIFADGRIGGTGSGAMGAQNQKANPGASLSGKVVDATWGDTYHITLEEVSSGSNTYLLKTQDGKYNYVTSNSNGFSSTTTRATAANYPITVTFTSSSDVKLGLGGTAQGAVLRYNTSGYFRYYSNGGQQKVYLYKKTGGATGHTTSCTACPTNVTVSYSAPSNGTMSVTKNDAAVASGTSVKTCKAQTLSVTLTPATHYNVTGFTATGLTTGTATITPTPNTVLPSSSAQTFEVAISSGATGTLTLTPTFTAAPQYSITWHTYNNDNYTTGNPTTSVYQGEGITRVPTAPSPKNDWTCADTFVGWSTTNQGSDGLDKDLNAAEIAALNLFTTYDGAPAITGNTHFYAIFAKATGGGTATVLSETFDNSLTSDDNNVITSSTFASFSGSTDKAYKGAYGTLKLGSSKYDGYVTSQSLDLSGAFHVKMDVAQYGTDNGSVTVTVYDASDLTTALASQTINTYGTGKTLDFAAATATSVIEIESTNRVYIDNVVVTTGGTAYTNYVTTCCTSLSQLGGTPVVEQASQTSATVTWNAMENYSSLSGNSNVTGYIVKVYNDNAGARGTFNKSQSFTGKTTTNGTVTGLTAGNIYWFTVSATTSGSTYCEISTESAASKLELCSWRIDYQTGGASGTWSSECFADSTSAVSNMWMIEGFEVQDVAGHYWVGPGAFTTNRSYNTALSSGIYTARRSTHNRSDNAHGTNYAVQTGMVGDLFIYDNNTTNNGNYYSSLIPHYQITYGVEGGAAWKNVQFKPYSGTEYHTDTVAAPGGYFENADFKYYVGAKKSDGTTIYFGKSSTVRMDAMTGMTTDQSGKRGYWKMYDDSGDANWYVQWVALPYYTVTLIDNDDTTRVEVYAGQTFTLPVEGASDCEDATFLGWHTGTSGYTAHKTGIDDAPTYDAGGTEKTITKATTFIAVYNATKRGGGTTPFTGSNEGPFYIYADVDGTKHYTTSTITSSTMTATTNADEAQLWTLTKGTGDYAAYYIISYTSGETTYYLGKSNSANNNLATMTSTFNANTHYWSIVAGTNGSWRLVAKNQNSYALIYRGKTSDNFKAYAKSNASAGNAEYFDLELIGTAPRVYTSIPYCCHASAEPLALSADPEVLVGSGKSTITVTGGNSKTLGKSITGTEAGAKVTLSGRTLTATLPSANITTVYTVKVTQTYDDTDPTYVYCADSVTIDITVRSQDTIIYMVNEGGTPKEYSRVVVTEGSNYTLPDISEDYTCGDNISFAGWSTSSSATAVEKAVGSVVTVEESTETKTTWWAVWQTASASTTENRDRYSLVTDASTLAENDVFVLVHSTASNNYAHGTITTGNYSGNANATLGTDGNGEFVTFATGETPQKFTLKGSAGAWKLMTSTTKYVQSDNKSYNLTTTEGDATVWDISISGTADISDGTYSIKYNTTSPRWYPFSGTTLQLPKLYKKDGKVTVEVASGTITYGVNTPCTCGPIIRATDNQWVTSVKDNTVKIYVPVTAKNFTAATTLSATSSNEHFEVSIQNPGVPIGSTGRKTKLIVAYTPVASGTTENAIITLTAGDVTKSITVHGRSLPDEFAIITKKGDTWYALPANMANGPGNYAGVPVTPDDNDEPASLPAAPFTVLYNAREVVTAADSCMRLTGNSNKYLWANNVKNNNTIQNKFSLDDDAQIQWLLRTADGDVYKMYSPAHAEKLVRQLALGGTTGTDFGLFKTEASLYIVPVGCSSLPANVKITTRRVQATFSWTSNASSMVINAYTDKAMSTTPVSITASSSPAVLNNLAEKTKYYVKMIPDESVACQYVDSFETTGPTIDVAEWFMDSVHVFIDAPGNPRIIVQGEEEHGTAGAVATTLFFSKYFEGSGSMKLLAIFNGTANDISLADYTIKELHAGKQATTYGSTKEYDLSELGSIAAGQEIIFYTKPTETDLVSCSTDFFASVAGKSGASENPRWIQCDGNTFKKLEFNGNDALILYNGDDEVDIFGAMSMPGQDTPNCRNEDSWEGSVINDDYHKAPSDEAFAELFSRSSLDFSSYSTEDSIAHLENCDINLNDSLMSLSTARCILFRNKTVTAGAAGNTGDDFASFIPDQWNGRSVCINSSKYTTTGFASDGPATCNSYQYLGEFDYNKYYRSYTDGDTTYLNELHSNSDGTKTIEIPHMRSYTCLSLRFQVTDPENVANVLTEQVTQVPIIVLDNRYSNDTLFTHVVKNDETHAGMVPESIERCKTCNVVIRNGGVLTKRPDGYTNDVAELFNLKVYPGGQLVIPAKSGANRYTYTVNTLAIRRQEDDLAWVNMKDTIQVVQTKGVYFDLRIDPSSWHYVALPFDCDLKDVTYSDGTPAALGTDYVVGWYDGAYRAANKKGGWTNVEPGSTLKKGMGYIISIPGSGSVRRELRFPMSNDVIADEKQDKIVQGLYAYGGNVHDTILHPNHKGWNMIGNPYLYTYTKSILEDPLKAGELVRDTTGTTWNGKLIIKPGTESLRYVVEPINNGWSGYSQTLLTRLNPFTAYFVQIGSSIDGSDNPETEQGINFVTTGIDGRSSMPRRAAAEVEDNHPVWYGVELVAPNGEKDNTTLLISDRFTDGYDMMNDLVKMRGDYYNYYQLPVLASRNNEGEMAFNALPDASAEAGVPLNYYAAQKGTYTFTTDGRFDLEEVKAVMLHDATTNEYYDLLANNYTFTTNKGNNTNRFKLLVFVERRAPQIATDVDNILTDGQLSLIAIDKTLVLSGLTNDANVYVYDISGKLLTGERAYGNSGVWRATVPAAGVYFVRVNSAAGQQTLRTVVK